MYIYYDHGRVRITDQSITVDGRRYPLGDLRNLGKSRGRYDKVVVRVAVASLNSTLIGLLIGLVLPGEILAGFGCLGIFLGLVAAALARLRPRPFRFWADVRGTPTMLYATSDEDEFGKVVRAAARAHAFREPKPHHLRHGEPLCT